MKISGIVLGLSLLGLTFATEEYHGLGPVGCRDPSIKYGGCGDGQDFYLIGSKIECYCQPGYELDVSYAYVVCKPGGWKPRLPTCTKVVYKCPVPKQPVYGSYTPAKSYHVYPNSITYTCIYGYELSPSSSLVRQCQENGKWDEPEPICVPGCVKVCKVDHPEEFQGSYEPVKPYYYPDEMIIFTCDEGYCLIGDAKQTCQENGKWNTGAYPLPICVRSCDEPDVPYGSVAGSDPPYCWTDYVWFHCDDGYTNIGDKDARCQADGSWTGYADCKPVVKKCKKPYIENGGFHPRQKWYQVGDVVHFYCDDGYVLNGERTATCRNEGQWTGLPTCERKIGKGSCKRRCGGGDDDYYSHDCQCDYRCKRFYNCCEDYDSYCKGYNPEWW